MAKATRHGFSILHSTCPQGLSEEKVRFFVYFFSPSRILKIKNSAKGIHFWKVPSKFLYNYSKKKKLFLEKSVFFFNQIWTMSEKFLAFRRKFFRQGRQNLPSSCPEDRFEEILFLESFFYSFQTMSGKLSETFTHGFQNCNLLVQGNIVWRKTCFQKTCIPAVNMIILKNLFMKFFFSFSVNERKVRGFLSENFGIVFKTVFYVPEKIVRREFVFSLTICFLELFGQWAKIHQPSGKTFLTMLSKLHFQCP